MKTFFICFSQIILLSIEDKVYDASEISKELQTPNYYQEHLF